MNHTTDTTRADQLRQRMVDGVRAGGYATNPRTEHVMRKVKRDRFVPDATLDEAYADEAVITKRAEDGQALSCASVPSIVALMLDQLDPRPGQRVCEIGAGSGYNAAMLADLVGENGEVTTIDRDAEVTAQARKNLAAEGYGRVRVIPREGVLGVPEYGPYDRFTATVGCWDIPTAWREQLVPGATMVVPLRFRGTTRSVLFVRPSEADRLESRDMRLCGFVPLVGQEGEREANLDPDHHVNIYWDDDQPINPNQLAGVFDWPGVTDWSPVTVGPQDTFDNVWLHTAMHPTGCRIAADDHAVKTGLCTPVNQSRTPALARDESIAYLVSKRVANDTSSTLGATGHGPHADQLVGELIAAINAWNTDRKAVPTATVLPSNAHIEPEQHSAILDKHECRITLRFDTTQNPS